MSYKRQLNYWETIWMLAKTDLKMRYQGEWRSVNDVLDSILESIPMANEEKGL